MDLQLKQWRSQQQNESEEQVSATKISNFFFDQIQTQTATSAAALPLFVPEPTSSSSFSCFSPDSSSSRFLKMGNFFSYAQWQELELQALIYRYMLAGASVPQELLLPIKKSLFHQSPLHFLHHPLQHNFPHHQPSWYWGRGAMDPEPGRCKRTDGKKWRCSRDVVGGHKYCDRHIHRGRNRSRKPVETAATTAASSFVLGEELGGHRQNNNLYFSSGSSHSSSQHLHLNSHQSCSSEMKQESNNNNNNNKRPYEGQSGFSSNVRSDDGHILRHFFDDWPRSSDSTSSPMSSSTCHLSISMPGNTSSDVSLKLSTGNEEENMRNNNENEREQQQQNMNWWSSGGGNHHNMGGPLAEALRSASSTTSSVLHQMGISTQIFH
uniref:Growth-regulating factor n=1 Tax=Noccaea caerulescens TaxID=107243 RepID=A0A1J3DRE3_NOCCA